MEEGIKYLIGIDEVGRGPLAGPVAVCAFVCSLDFFDFLPKKKGEKNYIRDSKKLSRRQRQKWFELLSKYKKEGKCDFVVTFVSAENIDKFGIGKCIQKALNKSLEKITSPEFLFARSSEKGGESSARPSQKEIPAKFYVYLDGGLKAPKEYIYQETIIKGDETHPVISLASIIAKVSRDKVMLCFAKEFPEYGFEKHVGYGTKVHYEAIKKYGQLPIHRKTFIH
jgi:ribonuclease HII